MAGIDFALHIPPEIVGHLDRSIITDTKIIYRASTRGHLNEGWLESYHTFNYAGYHDPMRTGFGMLRVLNEDTIAPGMGFPPHRHENMEIISIPLEGSLEHRDSLGNNIILRKDEIQVMSAGTGLKFDERNAYRDRLAKFLQLWVYPAKRNVQPRYAHVKIDKEAMQNNLMPVVSPEEGGCVAWINQNVWLHMGKLDKGYEFRYRVRSRRNGVYVFLIRGEAEVNGDKLRSHDSIGLWDTRCVDIQAKNATEIVLMEVPMV